MKKLILLFSIFIMGAWHPVQSQYKVDRPKLVVGIVVDQMRYDYLTRFYPKYGEGGFKRLLNEGFSCENSHYNYIPTYTAVGHASIYTGTTGSTHGIISNYWYDKFERKSIYCVDDFNYPAVGTTSTAEQKSPYRMLTTTVTDELRLSQNMNGKTIAVGLKDRSAVLPGGHSSNGSYWFHGMEEGNFVTSAYYMDALPKWVNQFNESGLKESYIGMKWETLYPIKEYTESIEDDNVYENPFEGEVKPVFPHDLPELKDFNGGYDLIKTTPFGNTLVMEFAKAAIEGEKLGARGYTDFLALSFSSPDLIGHRFGVDSKEIQDTYLRLDRDLAELLNFLDQKVGKGEYTVFLTADHAAVQVPAYLKSKKIPAGYFDEAAFGNFIREHCASKWGSSEIIEYMSNFQIFLRPEKLNELKLSKEEVSNDLVELIINYEGVNKALTAMTLQRTEFSHGMLSRLQKGYNQKLSGDVLWIPDPAVTSYSHHGSTHGSGYSYDTHVPVIFFGKGIKRGVTHEKVEIIDIAPTISSLLKISFPNGSSGRVIESVLK